jgi:proteasome lid subunit RPN8/RPN11
MDLMKGGPTRAENQETTVEVRQSVLGEITAHARAEAPLECCGILIGTGRRIERATRARNQLRSPTRYLIEPEDHFAALKSAREDGQAVVGFYHSHPASAPAPSETDRLEAAYPGHWHLIVFPGTGTQPPEVRAFQLMESGNFLPATLVPIP